MNQSHGITRIIGCLALAGALCASVAHCQVYVVGANTFPTDASGAWINNGFTETTDANNGGHTTLHLNGSGFAGMSLLLTPGVNTIQFVSDLNESAGFSAGYVGMNLFLNGTGTSFNPTTGPNAGNLTITGHAGSPTFFVDSAGTSILSYDSGLSGTMANGATSFSVNGEKVTVTGFTVSPLGTSGFPVGTLTLDVVPVPEPSSLAVLFPGMFGVLVALRRRRLGRNSPRLATMIEHSKPATPTAAIAPAPQRPSQWDVKDAGLSRWLLAQGDSDVAERANVPPLRDHERQSQFDRPASTARGAVANRTPSCEPTSLHLNNARGGRGLRLW